MIGLRWNANIYKIVSFGFVDFNFGWMDFGIFLWSWSISGVFGHDSSMLNFIIVWKVESEFNLFWYLDLIWLMDLALNTAMFKSDYLVVYRWSKLVRKHTDFKITISSNKKMLNKFAKFKEKQNIRHKKIE